MALYRDPLEGDEEAQRLRALQMFDLGLGPKSPVDAFKQTEPTYDMNANRNFGVGKNGAPIAGIGMYNDPIETGLNVDSLNVPSIGKVRNPGLLGRIRQQPGGSQALLAFGANMLMSNDFFEGLGKGALAYQGTLDAEAEKLKPKFTKDFTHTYQMNPETGQMEMKRTSVADYEENIVDKKLITSENNSRYRADRTYDGKIEVANIGARTAQEELDFKDRWNKRDNDTDLKIANIQSASAERRAKLQAATVAGKPISASVIKQYDEHSGTVTAIDTTLVQAEPILTALDNGTLKLGVVENIKNKAALATGVGVDDSAIMYGQMNTLIEGIRNTVLMDAKGVQTDGDAERAKAQLLSGTGSAASVRKNLQIVLDNLRKRREYANARAEDIARGAGMDTSSTNAVRSGGGGGDNKSSMKQKYGLQ